MALSADLKRVFEFNENMLADDIPMVAGAATIYEGSAVGESASTGNARALVAGDTFLGFSIAQRVQAAGAAIGAENARVYRKGTVKLAVTGVTGDDDLNAAVYASDDGTFTLSSTGNSSIGKVGRWISGTTCMVRFEAESVRSI